MQELNNKLRDLINKYREILKQIKERTEATDFHIAQAVYFATYFNSNCTATYYYVQNMNDDALRAFFEHWENVWRETCPEEKGDFLLKL